MAVNKSTKHVKVRHKHWQDSMDIAHFVVILSQELFLVYRFAKVWI